jgi:hypothetical protein
LFAGTGAQLKLFLSRTLADRPPGAYAAFFLVGPGCAGFFAFWFLA